MLLLSRVIQALTADDAKALPVADLAKLASILKAVSGQAVRGRRRRSRSRTSSSGEVGSRGTTAEPAKVAEAVRMVYGLPWPPMSEAEQ